MALKFKKTIPFKIIAYIVQSVNIKIQYRKAINELKKEYQAFINSNQKEKRFEENNTTLYPCFDDKTSDTPFEPHYTYHPAWAARILAQNKTQKHVDISSSLRFCTMISAFVPTEFYDFRPANIKLSNLNCHSANLLALPFESNSITSLSCMHTIEHIGLGRYGDDIDYNGDLKAIAELTRVLAPGGNLLIVVPIGKPKIEYNAHRIYSYQQLVSYFGTLQLKEFSLVPDDFEQFGLVSNASEELANQQHWGCGCFWFTK